MREYLFGLATLPVAAFALWGGLLAARAISRSWQRWRPTFVGEERRRADLAAALAVARRVLVIKLPGGRVLAWRSTVGRVDERGAWAWACVRDGIDEALRQAGNDPVVTGDRAVRPGVVARFADDPDGGPEPAAR